MRSRRRGRTAIRAKKTTIDGVEFASKAEARRYGELKLMEAAGEISDIRPHPKFDLIVNGQLVCVFTPDFLFFDNLLKRPIIEEVKGGWVRSSLGRAYKIQRNLFCALNPGYIFREVLV